MSSFRSIRDLPPRQRRSRPFRLQIPRGEASPRFFRAHRAGRIVDYLEDKKGRTWCPAWRFSGAPCRARTCDLRIRSPTLYPAELRARAEGQYTPAGPARQEFFRTGERRALWRPAVAARDDQPAQPADPGRRSPRTPAAGGRREVILMQEFAGGDIVPRRGDAGYGRRGLRAARAPSPVRPTAASPLRSPLPVPPSPRHFPAGPAAAFKRSRMARALDRSGSGRPVRSALSRLSATSAGGASSRPSSRARL